MNSLVKSIDKKRRLYARLFLYRKYEDKWEKWTKCGSTRGELKAYLW